MPDMSFAKDTVQVALCCDENYVAYANVVMLSALKASSSGINFHLIGCNLAASSLSSLADSVESHGGTLSVYQPDNMLYQGLPTHRYGPAVYQRINLPEYLPERITKVLYIDSDTLVLEDLATLWNTDLEGMPIAAVENLSPKACTDIGVPRNEYFNSGVLLMDLGQWRAEGIHHDVTAYLRKHAERLQFVDQCALNGVLQGRWKRLPVHWNMQSDIYKVVIKYAEGCSYSISQLQSAISAPGIVHFTGKKKPWKIVCFHPFKQYYRRFLEQTPWADLPPPDDTFRARWEFFTAFRQNWKHWRRTNRLSERYRGK